MPSPVSKGSRILSAGVQASAAFFRANTASAITTLQFLDIERAERLKCTPALEYSLQGLDVPAVGRRKIG
jgi:hypothetical protein